MINLDVRETLVDILVNYFSISRAVLSSSETLPFTGAEIAMESFQLYEFLMLVEEHYKIYFSPKDFASLSFRSLGDAEKAVKQKLVTTEK